MRVPTVADATIAVALNGARMWCDCGGLYGFKRGLTIRYLNVEDRNKRAIYSYRF